jgi:hypothetical protein
VGTWQTTKTFAGNTINGPWTFNVYGEVSSNIGDGALYAVVKGSGGTTIDTTVYDTEDVFDYTNSHMFTWTDTLAGAIPAGQGVIVELWIHVTSVLGGVTLTTTGTTQAGGPHDVWFCAVDAASDSEFDTPNAEASTVEWTDTYYTNGGTTNNVRAGPSGNPGIGDEIFVKNWFATTVNPAAVTNIQLTYEAQYSATGVMTMYAYNANSMSWDTVGATMNVAAINTDYTMVRSITSNFADYISGNQILWGVYVSTRSTCSVDFMEVDITISPSATFDANIDYATAQSNVQPTINGGGPTPYEINLSGKSANSWVFVSFPSALSGNIQTILNDGTAGDSGTTWTIAKWFDAQDKADPWKTYRVGSSMNDMPTLNSQMGVWLWITANGGDQMLTLSSYAAPSGVAVNVPLYTGWNMVGYPSMTSRAETATLTNPQIDYVSVWQAASPYVTDHAPSGAMMSAGNAYWIHVTADCTWVVQP